MFSLAKKIAKNSQHKQHYHSCIIVSGNKIIATGYNHKFMHAEIDALRKVVTRAIRSGRHQRITLYSFRWRKGGGFGMAKPCDKCYWNMRLAKMYTIDALWYTNERGELTKL